MKKFFNNIFNMKKEVKKIHENTLEFGSDNSCLGNNAFVLKIEDIDNTLKILFSGSIRGEKGSDVDESLNDEIKELLKDSYPVYPNEEELYEITFPDYIIYQVRNEWMVDRSNLVIAVFNGQKSGTKNTIDYAGRKKREIINLMDI